MAELDNKPLKKEDLENFTGTEGYYKHYSGIKYTDGIKYLITKGNCFWFIDIIASYQKEWKSKAQFQVWGIKVNLDKTAVVTMKQDSNLPIDIKQELEYADFPFEDFECYCIDGIILLKSEY